MRILFLGHHLPSSMTTQDMLLDSLLYGLVRTYGSVNVSDYFDFDIYRGKAEYLADWPIFLGAMTYAGQAEPMQMAVGDYDVQFVSCGFLWRALQGGLCSKEQFQAIVDGLDSDKLILIRPDDNRPGWHDEHWFPYLWKPPRLLIGRPPYRWLLREMPVHICLPQEWLQFQISKVPPCEEQISVYACLNDNHPSRRKVMRALLDAKIKDARLRWGSFVGYPIKGTEGNVGVPYYYREMEASACVVACRGESMDTLRVWEALALGKLLITDNFGFDDFQHERHVLRYETPPQCVELVKWALEYPDKAQQIAQAGHELYLLKHTPQVQAMRIMEEAGFV